MENLLSRLYANEKGRLTHDGNVVQVTPIGLPRLFEIYYFVTPPSKDVVEEAFMASISTRVPDKRRTRMAIRSNAFAMSVPEEVSPNQYYCVAQYYRIPGKYWSKPGNNSK